MKTSVTLPTSIVKRKMAFWRVRSYRCNRYDEGETTRNCVSQNPPKMGLFFVERKKFPVILLDRVQQPVNFHPWIPAIVNGHSAAWIFDTAISFDSFSESSRIDKKKQKNKKKFASINDMKNWLSLIPSIPRGIPHSSRPLEQEIEESFVVVTEPSKVQQWSHSSFTTTTCKFLMLFLIRWPKKKKRTDFAKDIYPFPRFPWMSTLTNQWPQQNNNRWCDHHVKESKR